MNELLIAGCVLRVLLLFIQLDAGDVDQNCRCQADELGDAAHDVAAGSQEAGDHGRSSPRNVDIHDRAEADGCQDICQCVGNDRCDDEADAHDRIQYDRQTEDDCFVDVEAVGESGELGDGAVVLTLADQEDRDGDGTGDACADECDEAGHEGTVEDVRRCHAGFDCCFVFNQHRCHDRSQNGADHVVAVKTEASEDGDDDDEYQAADEGTADILQRDLNQVEDQGVQC